MLLPPKIALTICAAAGIMFGAATMAQAAPAAGIAQSAPVIATTAAPAMATLPHVQKAQYWRHRHWRWRHHHRRWWWHHRHHRCWWHHGRRYCRWW